MATTNVQSFQHGSSATVESLFTDYLGDFHDDYDLNALAEAYRARINNRLLGTSVVLCGNEYFCDYDKREYAGEWITEAEESITLGDLDEMAELHVKDGH